MKNINEIMNNYELPTTTKTVKMRRKRVMVTLGCKQDYTDPTGAFLAACGLFAGSLWVILSAF